MGLFLFWKRYKLSEKRIFCSCILELSWRPPTWEMQREQLRKWARKVPWESVLVSFSLLWSKYLREPSKKMKDSFWLRVLEVSIHSPGIHSFWACGEAVHHGGRSMWQRLLVSWRTGARERDRKRPASDTDVLCLSWSLCLTVLKNENHGQGGEQKSRALLSREEEKRRKAPEWEGSQRGWATLWLGVLKWFFPDKGKPTMSYYHWLIQITHCVSTTRCPQVKGEPTVPMPVAH
jgi:hypothetical protein